MHTSVRYLKDHLSEILKTVQLGQEVSITSHHQLIAKLIPVTDKENLVTENRESFIQQLKNLQLELAAEKLPSMTQAVLTARDKERF